MIEGKAGRRTRISGPLGESISYELSGGQFRPGPAGAFVDEDQLSRLDLIVLDNDAHTLSVLVEFVVPWRAGPREVWVCEPGERTPHCLGTLEARSAAPAIFTVERSGYGRGDRVTFELRRPRSAGGSP